MLHFDQHPGLCFFIVLSPSQIPEILEHIPMECAIYPLDEGIQSVIASEGEQAIKLFNSIDFDIVLLDWKMPKLTGLEV